MSDKESRRRAAMRAFHDREAETARATSDRRRAVEDEAARREAQRTAWVTAALNWILMGVNEVNNAYAQLGSRFTIRQVTDGRSSDRSIFHVEQNGSGRVEAKLAFSLGPDGIVHPETDALGITLPEGVAVEGVTPKWAEEVADELMDAILRGDHQRIPDTPDFMKGGFQTQVPVQPRTGRTPRRR